MRPGPGLVVMALAFISGARRGTSQQSSAIEGRKLGEFEEDNTEALSRINPWLSACDLAQPNTAPDLQGQCSAGTLPVAWIDEGPGPPRCPPPCMAKSNNKNSNFKANNIDNTKYNMENRLNDKQQCLDYLGDNEELSPAQICKKSSQSIETKLRTTRLRHCCERTVGSALHNEAYAAVLRGGSECVRMLSDLLETDALAARITCEFTEVLVRYDCGQRYSIIHHCEDCKEAYRRWGCTIFLPYFATSDDLVSDTMSSQSSDDGGTGDSGRSGASSGGKSVNNKTGSDGNRATQGKSNANYRGDSSNKQTEPNLSDANKQQLVKNISINVKSSRRKTQRVRIRPCLDVCQTVEQKCPYMLPGDRAPAYPTQYAGEPTFLCQDLYIGETGEQLLKSNSGREDCCYSQCGTDPLSGVCAKCDPLLQDEADNGGDNGDDGAEARAQLDKVAAANKTSSNTTILRNSSSNDISRSSSSSTATSAARNILAELISSSQQPPRLRTCPSISSATMTALQQTGQCRAAQQSASSQEQQEPSTVDDSSEVGFWTTPASSVASSISSSASSLASSSSFIKFTSVKSVYDTYFNNSWTMRLRCLDEFVAWTKILLQLAGL